MTHQELPTRTPGAAAAVSDQEAFAAIQAEVRLQNAARRAGVTAGITREESKGKRYIRIMVCPEMAQRIAALLEGEQR